MGALGELHHLTVLYSSSGVYLYLSGNFSIEDDRVLAFQPEEGTFFGMHLEKATIEDLFVIIVCVFDLKNIQIKYDVGGKYVALL